MTEIHVFNTATRRREPFHPIDPRNVRLYVCGPTVYDFAHIGNARPVVVFDTFVRLLRHIFGDGHVTYARNITDVDDRINERARQEGVSIHDVTVRTAAQYHQDMAALNALPPDIEPRATAHIAEMIAMIEVLIAKGHAYAAEGHVLFHVPTMPSYGDFANRSTEELLEGARVEVAPYKKNAGDFVLWKPSDEETPGWDSPWGRGRPGWHIECSAMSEAHLGTTFDVHGGGLDLIFPHHQNEIAQSECAHDGAVMANYWMHNGFVVVEGEKMSKSLGNFFTVHDLLDEFPGEVIRMALLATHYRQPLDFTREGMRQARQSLDRWYRAVGDAEAGAMPASVIEALADDLNMPKAIAAMHALADAALAGDRAAAGALRAAGALTGLLQQDQEGWFRGDTGGLDAGAIETLIEQRHQARQDRNFAEADRIRDELASQGIVLEDKPGGETLWRKAG